MAALYRRPSLFGFPGVAPGFDPKHLAANGLRFSGIATSGGGFVNLLNGSNGSLTGSASGGVTLLGPSLGASSTQYATFSGLPTITDGPCTIAAIFSVTTSVSQNAVITTRAAGTVAYSLYASSLVLAFNEYGNFGYPFPALTLSLGVPYFAAISKYGGSGTLNLSAVLVNLLTGKVAVSTLSASTGHMTATSDGSYVIGSDPSHGSSCKVAAAMYSGSSTSASALLSWAADPWAFWYPNNLKEFATAGTTPPPPTVIIPTRTMMGVGV